MGYTASHKTREGGVWGVLSKYKTQKKKLKNLKNLKNLKSTFLLKSYEIQKIFSFF